MSLTPSHFGGRLPAGTGTSSPVSSVLSSTSPAITDTAPPQQQDVTMDASTSTSDASNPLKRTIDQVDGAEEVGSAEVSAVVGGPEGTLVGHVAQASETGTATTTAIEVTQPGTTPKGGRKGRPAGAKTVPKNLIPPPVIVPRPRRTAANPLNPPSQFFIPPSAARNNSLAIFDEPQPSTQPTASSSTAPPPADGDVTGVDSLESDVGKLRAARAGMDGTYQEVVSSERTRTRPTPKTVSGPTRRGPSALNKGKGKASDDEYAGEVLNNDFCDACRGTGRFLCCDGCPRSFHFSCLDPPIDMNDVPEDQWFCVDCAIKRSKRDLPRPPSNIFGPLFGRLQRTNPTQYSLPGEIRDYFQGVATSSTGTYVDQDRIKPIKLDRRGFAEDRDPLRLKDAKGSAVLCYRCGGSAAPKNGSCETTATTVQGEPSVEISAWRKIMSCDYCGLHWHIDCLDPPLSNMPLPTVKWMCPNHIEHVMKKVRIPKRGMQIVDVQGPSQRNNGYIEIIPSGPLVPVRVKYEEMIVNSKKYRVPEESIRVDFWNKALGIPDKPRTFRPSRTRGHPDHRHRRRHAPVRKPMQTLEEQSDSGSASDLTSLDSDSSPELGPEDFAGPSSGVPPISLGGSPLVRRPSTTTKIEQPTDLMTLTLTHSPLRHAASAQLAASKLRRSSLPPTPSQAAAIPYLLRDAMGDARPSALGKSVSHPHPSGTIPTIAVNDRPPVGLVDAAPLASGPSNGGSSSFVDQSGTSRPESDASKPKITLRLNKPTSLVSASSSTGSSILTAPTTTSSPTKTDAHEGDVDLGMVTDSNEDTSGASTPLLATFPPAAAAPTVLGRPPNPGGPTRKTFHCPKEGCTKSYKQQNGLKYHLEIGQCNTSDSPKGRQGGARVKGSGTSSGKLPGRVEGGAGGDGGEYATRSVGGDGEGKEMSEEEVKQLRSLRALMQLNPKSQEEMIAFFTPKP